MAGVFDQLVKQKFEGLILTNNNQAGWPEELSQLNREGKPPGEFPRENEVFGQVFNWWKQLKQFKPAECDRWEEGEEELQQVRAYSRKC